MDDIRQALKKHDILDVFDRVVFESIVDKVIVGDVGDDGVLDPYKLTFILKGDGKLVMPKVKEHYKAAR